MSDFGEFCTSCPFVLGKAELTKDWLNSFSCPCHEDANCSYLDNAREYVNDYVCDFDVGRFYD